MTPAEYKAIREKLGLTQAGLAARLGVTRKTVNSRENGAKITEEAALAILSLSAQDIESATYCSAFFELATKWASRAIALDHLAEKNKCIITDAEAGIFRQFAEELIEVANTTIEARREADALRRLVEACGSIDNDISTPAELDEAYAEARDVLAERLALARGRERHSEAPTT
ncbi:MAG TPA: helix-turn-helix domain-containing protein [Verrucomicrobiales bacterium]|nr:helix-turn-helix domain-containing protein [Verrucomicrobiales bacterium]